MITSSTMSPHWMQRSTQKMLCPVSLSRSIHISWVMCPLHRAQLFRMDFFVVTPAAWESIVFMCTSSYYDGLWIPWHPQMNEHALYVRSLLSLVRSQPWIRP